MSMSSNGGEGMTAAIGASGATIPAGSGEVTMVAAFGAGGGISFDSVNQVHGSKCFVLTTASGVVTYIKATWASTLAGACDFTMKTAATVPAAGQEPGILQLRSGTSNLYTVTHAPSTGKLRIKGGAGQVWESASAFDPSVAKSVRISWAINTADTSTSFSSKVRVAVFGADSDAAILDSGWITAYPITMGLGCDSGLFGRVGTSTDTTTIYVDDVRYDPASTDLIPFAGSLLPAASEDKNTGDIPSTVVTVTVTATRGNANTKGYAIKIEFSAIGDFSDTTTYLAQTAFQANGTFTYQPSTKGSYRVTPYAQQNPI